MILFADLHLREESAEIVFDRVFPGLLDACVQRKDKHLVCLGDFYHHRYQVSVSLQNRVARWLDTIAKEGLYLTLLPGNHDQVDRAGDNALRVFWPYPNVHVISEPVSTHDGLWIPYRADRAEVEAAFKERRHPYEAPVLFLHGGVRGACINDGRQDTDGLDPQAVDPKRFRVAFAGHYHHRQTVGSVVYVGSPYQTRADEAGNLTGYVVFDAKSFKWSWVDTAWGPRYHHLRVSPGSAIDLSGVAPGDDVRVVVEPGAQSDAVVAYLEKHGVKKFAVTADPEPPKQRLTVQGQGTLRDFAEAYVQEFAGDLDKGYLMRLFEEFSRAI